MLPCCMMLTVQYLVGIAKILALLIKYNSNIVNSLTSV
jgi:hypothetical protein